MPQGARGASAAAAAAAVSHVPQPIDIARRHAKQPAGHASLDCVINAGA